MNLSKLADKCKKCPKDAFCNHKQIYCNHKQMETVAIEGVPKLQTGGIVNSSQAFIGIDCGTDYILSTRKQAELEKTNKTLVENIVKAMNSSKGGILC